MEKSGAKAYLVNTGWNGTGKRISIKDTRGIIDAILNGAHQQQLLQRQSHTSTLKFLQNFEGVDHSVSLILVTHMLMLLNGKKKQKILATEICQKLR